MNLGEARTELAGRGFDYLEASRVNTFLNDAKNTFEDAYPFPWLETSTSGASPLTIADLKQVLYVVDSTNNQELVGVAASQVVAELDPSITTTTGAPDVWWLDGEETIRTYPTTAVTLSVRYVKESPELSADSDTPLIPARYHQTWVDIAVIRAYMDSDNFVAALGLKQIVDVTLSQIITRYASRNAQNPGYQTIRGYSEDW